MSTIHVVASGIVATSGAAVLAEHDVWRLTAFLSLGASLGVLWSCLSKEGKEEGRMTNARILSGVVGGVCVPRLIDLAFRKAFNWNLQLETADPLVIIAIGFGFSVLGFYAMHAGLRRVETREKQIGGLLTKTVEKSIAAATGQRMEDEAKINETDSSKTSNH